MATSAKALIDNHHQRRLTSPSFLLLALALHPRKFTRPLQQATSASSQLLLLYQSQSASASHDPRKNFATTHSPSCSPTHPTASFPLPLLLRLALLLPCELPPSPTKFALPPSTVANNSASTSASTSPTSPSASASKPRHQVRGCNKKQRS